MFFEQPIDAVIGPSTLLVGGESVNEVAVGLKFLTLVADQSRDPDRGLGFVVGSAATGEEPSFSMNANGSVVQSSRLASTTSSWASRRIGLPTPVP